MKTEFKVGDRVVAIGPTAFGSHGFFVGMVGIVKLVFDDSCAVELVEGYQYLYRKKDIQLESLIWADDNEIQPEP